MTYNEDNILILEPRDGTLTDSGRFDWLLAERWAVEYKRPAAWVLRGIWACREAGCDPAYFKRKYLERHPNEQRRPEVESAFRDLLRDECAHGYKSTSWPK